MFWTGLFLVLLIIGLSRQKGDSNSALEQLLKEVWKDAPDLREHTLY